MLSDDEESVRTEPRSSDDSEADRDCADNDTAADNTAADNNTTSKDNSDDGNPDDINSDENADNSNPRPQTDAPDPLWYYKLTKEYKFYQPRNNDDGRVKIPDNIWVKQPATVAKYQARTEAPSHHHKIAMILSEIGAMKRWGIAYHTLPTFQQRIARQRIASAIPGAELDGRHLGRLDAPHIFFAAVSWSEEDANMFLDMAPAQREAYLQHDRGGLSAYTPVLSISAPLRSN